MYRNKLMKPGLAALMALALVFCSPFGSLAAKKLVKMRGDCYTLFQDGEVVNGVLHRGIDVSHWQGEIDWKKAAADDVDFAILGVRYQGKTDPMLLKNAHDAHAAGIKLGAYIYSYATSVEDAEAEADFIIDAVKDLPISYPIVFDAENYDTLGALPAKEITRIINAFCDKVRAAGYYPMLYANDEWLRNVLDMSTLSQYKVWAAAYERLPLWNNYAMWQGTDTGSVNGVEGGVDIDLQFEDFSAYCPSDTWRFIDNNWYWYSDYMKQKDGLIFDGSNHYYLNGDGTVYTGWKTIDDAQHYFDPASGGLMRKGWRQIDGKWYWFDKDGRRTSGWVNDNGWFFLDESGVMLTGVRDIGGSLYYLSDSGRMLENTVVEYNGTTWSIDGSGVMQVYVPDETTAAAEGDASGTDNASAAEAASSETPAEPSAAIGTVPSQSGNDASANEPGSQETSTASDNGQSTAPESTGGSVNYVKPVGPGV